MAERITEEDLKAVGLGEESSGEFACPECGATFPSAFALGRHRFQLHKVRGSASSDQRRSHKRTRPARTRTTPPAKVTSAEGAVQAAVDEAVGTLIVIGGYVAIILPHTGIAIAGDPGGNGRLPVQSRAAVAGDILAEYAKRDARVLEAIQRFNLLFKGSAATKLVIDMAAVVAVDLGVVDPHMEMEIGPFREGTAFGPLKPVEMVVGDVVAAVDNLRAQYAPPPTVEEPAEVVVSPSASNGSSTPSRRTRRGSPPVVIDGGPEAT